MANGIIVPVLTSFNGAGIDAAKRQMGSLSTTLHGIARAAGIAGGAMIGYNLAVRAAQFATESIIQARDLERNMIALETVFDDLTPKMEAFAVSAEKIGLSQSDAAKSTTFIGSVLKQAGFEMDIVASQTQRLTKLAVDLSTTYGYDVSEALLGMTALFRGEYDPIEKFGVAMKQSEVNAVLAANGQSKLTGEARRTAEQMARLALLYQRSQDAQGAFERGSGTLYVEQLKLQAAFKNVQGDLGQALLPVLVSVAQALVPIVKDLGPLFVQLFSELAVTVKAFLNNRAQIVTLFANLISAFTALLSVSQAFGPLILNNINLIIGFVATWKSLSGAIALVTNAMNLYKTAVQGATAAQVALNITGSKGPWGLIVAGVSAVIGSIMQMQALVAEQKSTPTGQVQVKAASVAQKAADQAYADALARLRREQAEAEAQGLRFDTNIFAEANRIKQEAYEKARRGFLQSQAEAARYGAMATVYNGRLQAEAEKDSFQLMLEELLKGVDNVVDETKGGGAKIAKAQADIAKMLRESAAKEVYRGKLAAMGASGGLIEKILGLDNWWKTAQNLVKAGSGIVGQLQGLFNKTAEGIEELTRKQEEAAEATRKHQEALQKYRETLASVGDSLSQALSGYKPLAQADVAMGRHASAVASAFDDISKALDDNSENLIDNGNMLRKYAENERKVLMGIATSRDALAKKIDIARTISEGILQVGNITSMLEKETKTVTEKTVGYVGNLLVTVTRDVEQTISGSLATNFRNLLAKTKEYAANLKTLRSLGLNGQLFKQIVDAGVESGGATAASIVAGGSDAVKELNGLFVELNSVASDVSAATTDTMFSLGEDVTNAFIDGLLAQDAQLKSTAERMAESFSNAFKQALGTYVVNPLASPTGKLDLGQDKYAAFTNRMFSEAESMGMTINTSGTFGRATGSQINLTVNAGMGADGASIGSEIVNVIKKYERTNGAVWVAV